MISSGPETGRKRKKYSSQHRTALLVRMKGASQRLQGSFNLGVGSFIKMLFRCRLCRPVEKPIAMDASGRIAAAAIVPETFIWISLSGLHLPVSVLFSSFCFVCVCIIAHFVLRVNPLLIFL